MLLKPNLSHRQIWNLNFGFLGLQVCFSLLTANISRILSSIGADAGDLAFLWLIAPLSGLIVQPIIGYFSDRTWNRFGRRVPYIFSGVILTAALILVLPEAGILSAYLQPVIIGTGILFLIQSSLNGSMQPYRSLVGDMLNNKQSNLGYSVQAFLINAGGIIGALLPFLLTFAGLSNRNEDGKALVPTVAVSFYIGVILLLLTNLWTCIKVKEYSPEYLSKSEESAPSRTEAENKLGKKWPVLLRLTIVQLFSWFAFYYIWVYTTEGIAHAVWHTSDSHTEAYNEAANWFGVLTGFYSVVAAIASMFMSKLAEKINREKLYALALFLGGISLLSIPSISNQYMLLVPMIGVGIAWSIILSIPFAILSSLAPAGKMGVYMGLFNMTIVIPQIIAGLSGNFIFHRIAGGNALSMLSVAGVSLLLGTLAALFIRVKRN
jgi:maltose/moltooligosaccharide transporter